MQTDRPDVSVVEIKNVREKYRIIKKFGHFQRKRFQKVFDRPMGLDDPIFFKKADDGSVVPMTPDEADRYIRDVFAGQCRVDPDMAVKVLLCSRKEREDARV